MLPDAARTFKEKLVKYAVNLTSPLNLLALSLDPRKENGKDTVANMKTLIWEKLARYYGVEPGSGDSVQTDEGLFQNSNPYQDFEGDEVDLLFDFMHRGEAKCVYLVKLWRDIGGVLYPTLELLLLDRLSDSGQLIRCDSGRLTDASVELVMKLRGCNRFIG